MKNSKTKQIVISAMFAALCCVATMIIKIPSPLKGYLNLGDCIVLLCGFMLSPLYCFFAAGIGSGFADILSGYVIYGPATFLVKGLMALVAFYGFRLLHHKCGNLISRIISGIGAEVVMMVGYFLFAGFLYGFGPAAMNIPANAVQGAAGLILGVVLVKVFERLKFSFQ